MRLYWSIGLLLTCVCVNVAAAGRLVVDYAWIRSPPPGAMMLAGYAKLTNIGDMPLIVVGADSADFGDVSLHQSFDDGGVEHMRPLGDIEIAPGASVEFQPGGKHFMLMQSKRQLQTGDSVKIHIATKASDGVTAEFKVSELGLDRN